MTSQPFRLILPGQKRLREAFDAALSQAGFAFFKPSNRAGVGVTRDLTGTLPNLETYELRSEAALDWLADGTANIAIVGKDTLAERAATVPEADAPRALLSLNRIAACSLWVAAKPEKRIETFRDLESLRIATSYPALLQQILNKQRVSGAQLIPQKGGVESAIAAGRADAIFDIVQTGESLRQNGLTGKFSVFNSCAQIVAPAKRLDQQGEELLTAFTRRFQETRPAFSSHFPAAQLPFN